MSWFIVVVPRKDHPKHLLEEQKRMISKIVPSSLRMTADQDNIYIVGGGLDETFKYLHDDSSQNQEGWVVCGIGLERKHGSFSIVTQHRWNEILKNAQHEKVAQLTNGHFAAVEWNRREINVYCDALEIRRVYLVDTGTSIIISTRLDWLIPFIQNPTIRLEYLASEWTLLNSISDICFIDTVVRVGASGHIRIKDDKIFHSWNHWSPEEESDTPIASLLEEMAVLPLKEGLHLTLGLSGGVDSRTLLALLMNTHCETWEIHSCGEPGNPDVRIAEALADSLGIKKTIKHYILDEDESPDSIIQSLREYALHTEMSDRMVGYPRLRFLSELHSRDYWMIDGGFGELMRRSYGNTLIMKGKKAILHKDAAKLAPLLRNPRSPIFNDQIQNMFVVESTNQLQKALDSMGSYSRDDIGNWIDLFTIRYRLKNYPANGQSAYDFVVASYMPFAQQAIISSYLGISSVNRINNKINRNIIRHCNAPLHRIPLVGSGVVMPYWTIRHIMLSRVWYKFQKLIVRRSIPSHESFKVDVLRHLKDHVFDRLLSTNVKWCPLYNYDHIKEKTGEFYFKDMYANARFIEDWLTYDFWREHVGGNAK